MGAGHRVGDDDAGRVEDLLDGFGGDEGQPRGP